VIPIFQKFRSLQDRSCSSAWSKLPWRDLVRTFFLFLPKLVLIAKQCGHQEHDFWHLRNRGKGIDRTTRAPEVMIKLWCVAPGTYLIFLVELGKVFSWAKAGFVFPRAKIGVLFLQLKESEANEHIWLHRAPFWIYVLSFRPCSQR
jgi:hypothetical protein